MTDSVVADDLPITITLTNRQMSIVFGLLQTGPYNLVADIVQTVAAQFHTQLEAYQQTLNDQTPAESTAQAAQEVRH